MEEEGGAEADILTRCEFFGASVVAGGWWGVELKKLT